jgi:hypothetical protein
MIKRIWTVLALLAVLGLGSTGGAYADEGKENMKAYKELFDWSMKEKKGLMFYVNGQTIGGAVTRINDAGYVEVRNQTYGRIIIRAEQIDAVAAN